MVCTSRIRFWQCLMCVVDVCDLYAAFGAEKNYKKLDRELKRCLGVQHFKAKHQVKIKGKNITTGKVYIGYMVT